MARRTRLTHSDAWEEGYDLQSGNVGASLMSPPLTKAEIAAYRRELREKDAKRKPVGFAKWPETVEKVTGSAVISSKPLRAGRQGNSSTRSRQR